MWARAQQRALQQSQRTQSMEAECGAFTSVDDNEKLEQLLTTPPRSSFSFATTSATSEPATPHNTPVPDVFSTPPRTTPTKSVSEPSTPHAQQQQPLEVDVFSTPLLPNSASVRMSGLSGSLERSLFGAGGGGEITEASDQEAAASASVTPPTWSSSSVFDSVSGSSSRTTQTPGSGGDGMAVAAFALDQTPPGSGSQTTPQTPDSGGDATASASASAAAAFALDCQTPTAPAVTMPWLQRSLAERTVSTEVMHGGPVEDCALPQSVDGSCLSNAPEVRITWLLRACDVSCRNS